MSRVKILSLTVLLAACGAGNAEHPALSAGDSIPRATEVSMASHSVPPDTATSAQDLKGPMWRLVDYAGAQGVRINPSSRTAIRLSNGSLSGTGGCNRIGARYTINGTALSIGANNSTMRACVGEGGVHESAFLSLLAAVTAYSISDGRLTMRSAGGEPLLVFEPEVEASIFGRTWTVQNYNNGRGAVTSVLRGSTLTVTLAEDGSVTGHAGCNSFRSSYTASGSSLTIAAPAATKKLCGEPDGIMQQESAFLGALSKVASYYVENETLQLRDPGGAVLAVMRPGTEP